jgi:hypothetical protein
MRMMKSQELVGHLRKIIAGHLGWWRQWIWQPAGAGDEGGPAPSRQRPGDVPAVRGHQPQLPDRHAEGVGGHPVGLGGGLEPPGLVGGQDLLEQLGQAGVGQLGLGDVVGAVGQGGQPQPGIAQAPQRRRHLRVGRQLLHALEDGLLVGLGEGDAAPGGGGVQGDLGDGAELVVVAGGDGDQGGMDELVEPGLAG